MSAADVIARAMAIGQAPSPEAPPPPATKAIDYGTICMLVCDAVCEAIGEAEEAETPDAPEGTALVLMSGGDDDEVEYVRCYDGYAVACLDDGRHVKIPYTIDGYDVTVSEPDQWTVVEPDWQDVADYEPEDDEDDAGAVKMLPDGRIGGYAVRFGSPDEPDLSPMRDYFTKATDFWLDKWGWLDGRNQAPMLYHHAQDEATKDVPVVGVWTKARVDDVGIWLEGQIDTAHRYGMAVKELVRRGVLRLSSDSAPHLVIREPRPGGVHEVKRWPLITTSLTPSPAEPRLLSVQAIKAAYGAAGLLPPAELIDSDPETDGDDRESADGQKAADLDRERLLTLKLRALRLKETV